MEECIWVVRIYVCYACMRAWERMRREMIRRVREEYLRWLDIPSLILISNLHARIGRLRCHASNDGTQIDVPTPEEISSRLKQSFSFIFLFFFFYFFLHLLYCLHFSKGITNSLRLVYTSNFVISFPSFSFYFIALFFLSLLSFLLDIIIDSLSHFICFFFLYLTFLFSFLFIILFFFESIDW